MLRIKDVELAGRRHQFRVADDVGWYGLAEEQEANFQTPKQVIFT